MKLRRRRELSASFRDRLLNDTLPFWTRHAVDRECGGFTTFLDRRGEPLSLDKPTWIQCRFTWLLARLCTTLERRAEWLDLARHGIEFVTRHGFDTDGRAIGAGSGRRLTPRWRISIF